MLLVAICQKPLLELSWPWVRIWNPMALGKKFLWGKLVVHFQWWIWRNETLRFWLEMESHLAAWRLTSICNSTALVLLWQLLMYWSNYNHITADLILLHSTGFTLPDARGQALSISRGACCVDFHEQTFPWWAPPHFFLFRTSDQFSSVNGYFSYIIDYITAKLIKNYLCFLDPLIKYFGEELKNFFSWLAPVDEGQPLIIVSTRLAAGNLW